MLRLFNENENQPGADDPLILSAESTRQSIQRTIRDLQQAIAYSADVRSQLLEQKARRHDEMRRQAGNN